MDQSDIKNISANWSTFNGFFRWNRSEKKRFGKQKEPENCFSAWPKKDLLSILEISFVSRGLFLLKCSFLCFKLFTKILKLFLFFFYSFATATETAFGMLSRRSVGSIRSYGWSQRSLEGVSSEETFIEWTVRVTTSLSNQAIRLKSDFEIKSHFGQPLRNVNF